MNGDIDVQRVQFDEARDSAGAFGRKDGGAAAPKRIENDAVSPATVTDQIRNQSRRFDRRMELKVTLAGRVKAVDAGIVQHVPCGSDPLRQVRSC